MLYSVKLQLLCIHKCLHNCTKYHKESISFDIKKLQFVSICVTVPVCVKSASVITKYIYVILLNCVSSPWLCVFPGCVRSDWVCNHWFGATICGESPSGSCNPVCRHVSFHSPGLHSKHRLRSNGSIPAVCQWERIPGSVGTVTFMHRLLTQFLFKLHT